MNKFNCPNCGRFCKIQEVVRVFDSFARIWWGIKVLNTVWASCSCAKKESGK